MPVTLGEVAKRAGVSRQTAGCVVHGTGRICEATRQRVRDAAAALGFMPNAFSRAIRERRFSSIGLVADANVLRSALEVSLLEGVQQALDARSLALVLCRLHDEQLGTEGKVPRVLSELMVDGMLFNFHTDIPTRLSDLVERYRLPAVWVNAHLRHDCVFPDEEGAARRVTRHFIDQGHTRVSFADWTVRFRLTRKPHFSRGERYRGYSSAMREAGLKPTLLRGPADSSREARSVASREALGSANRPTAIVANSPTEATPLLYTARLALDLDVPRDLRVAVFQGRHTSYPAPVVTVWQPWHHVGRAAVELLHKKIEAPRKKLDPLPIGHEVVTEEDRKI